MTGPTGGTGATGGDWWVSDPTPPNEPWDEDITTTGFDPDLAIPNGAVTAAPSGGVPEDSNYYSLADFATRTAADWLTPVYDTETIRWNPFQQFLGNLLDALLGLPPGTTQGATITTIYTALTGLKDKADESFRTAFAEKIANKAADALVNFESRIGLNLVLDGSFNGANFKRFPLTDEQFSGYAIGEEAHSGGKSWKWYHYPGLACGFQMAPTTKIKHFDVFEGELWFAEAWIFPAADNHLTPGSMQIGATLSDSTGELDDLDIITDKYTGLPCNYPFNGPDMIRGQWNKINIWLEIPELETGGYDQAVFWVRSTANTTSGDIFWLDDVVVRQEATAAKAEAQSNLAQAVVNFKAKAGSNIVIDPGFNTNINRFPYNDDQVFGRVSVLAGGQAHTGLAGWKWVQETAADCGLVLSPTGKVDSFGVKETDQYLVSAYVYDPATNANGGNMRIGATFTDSSGVLADTKVYEETARSAITRNTWTKLEATVSVPAGYNIGKFWVIADSSTPAGVTLWVDDVVVREVTHPQNIIDKIHEAIVGAAPTTPRQPSTVVSNLQKSFADFWDGLTGNTEGTPSVSKLPSQVKTAAGLMNYNLGLAAGEANTAKLGNESTNKAVYNAFFGSGGDGTATQVGTTIEAIKARLPSGYTVETLVFSGTWTRPFPVNDITTPTEFWAICVGGGSGGGRGIANVSLDGSTRVGGIGGSGGRWLAQRIDPNSLTSTVSVTIGAGGPGDYWSGGNASPENGNDTSFGSYCGTGPGISASVADVVGYYSCEDSRPGFGGNGGSFGSTSGTDGDSTPLAAGGSGGGAGSDGGGGGEAPMDAATRAGGGGGGGGGYGDAVTAAGWGGNGGYPGGGGGGGGAKAGGQGGDGGGGAQGCIILLWK